jgi:hypothetical protein
MPREPQATPVQLSIVIPLDEHRDFRRRSHQMARSANYAAS